jgi:hypothetical protein
LNERQSIIRRLRRRGRQKPAETGFDGKEREGEKATLPKWPQGVAEHHDRLILLGLEDGDDRFPVITGADQHF